MKTLVITHIYNEEYLLPYWLEHHKHIFDHGIIIDYRSTDKSIEICKQICPEWTIKTSRNPFFTAIDVDREVMDIEEQFNGIKIALNTTEFIFCKKQLKDIFKNIDQNTWIKINFYCPQTLKETYPSSIKQLFSILLEKDILYNSKRIRYIHNASNGKYSPGRHEVQTTNVINTNDIYGIWLGYFPLNNHTLQRKLQIQTNIPQEETDRQFGLHHKRSLQEILIDNHNFYMESEPLEKINLDFYKMLTYKFERDNYKMHDTAAISGKLFAKHYGQSNFIVLDIGGYDQYNTLRRYFEELNMKYLCVDMDQQIGVDVVIKPNEKLPFETGSVDLVISSSCFEHDPLFWMTFKEICRVLKKGGYFYMNAPSNGPYHKYPGDNWRFYGDAGQALAHWSGIQLGNEEVHPVKVEETFFILPKTDIWQDFVCIWKRVDEKETSITIPHALKLDNGKLRRELVNEGYNCGYMI